ncbi:alpha/beta fold hydrolase [Mycobacterium fragae]|uniref:alpha/beta fold hydrolase n=1 Tax=Mycobacterium fragae TaxID=1260918 RepID=UPI000A16B8A3|nr:alpha/beta fold hydrolase [Mycobacterium fragae]MCV7400092.1 alpha/beta fold hydrolase [Mycobacterium fragae]
MLDDSATAPLVTDARDHLVSVGGNNIHVVENGPGEGPALLLIHGHAGSTAWWGQMIPWLAVDHRVIRLDLLGHGRSDKPADGYTMSEQARVVGSVLTQLGVNRVIAIGHSTGAVVATALAEQRRDIVTALVLIDTGPNVDAFLWPGGLGELVEVPVIGRLVWALRNRFTIRKALSSAFTREVDIPVQIIDDVRRMRHRTVATTPKETKAFLAQRSLPDRLRELMIPTLVIFGVEDRRWRSSSAGEFSVVPHVNVELLAGVGHTPMLEDPGRTAELITSFIQTGGRDR